MADTPIVGGAKDIMTQPGPPPYVIPTIIKDPNGIFRTVYINAVTGQIVNDITGYSILSGNSNIPNSLGAPTAPSLDDVTEDEDKDGTTDSVDPVVHGDHGALEGKDGSPSGSHNRGNQNPMDNFGYISKESGLGKAISKGLNVLGGMGGKAVNLGWNAMNEQAAETARNMIGAKNPSVRETIGNLVFGNKGQIAKDFPIGDKKYQVGFEALTPDKKTNLTPMEAVTRQSLKTVQDAIENAFTENNNLPDLTRNPYETQYSQEDPDFSLPDTAPTPTERPSFGQTVDRTSPFSNPGTPTGKGSAVGFIDAFGPARPNRPSDEITGAVRQAVEETFGPGYSVVGISGQEDPGHQHGSNRHKTGLALDFDVVDPSGKKVTDVNALNDLAANFAYDQGQKAQVGFGTGYMAPGRLHFDVTNMSNINPGQASTWGAGGIHANMAPALQETIDAARAGYQPTPFSNPGVPTARPDPTENQGFVSQDERPSRKENIFDKIGPKDFGPTVETPEAPSVANMGMTPAEAANKGFMSRTPQEVDRIAQTIAGELGPNTLKDLEKGLPSAKQELANMVATIENRAQSKSFTGLQQTLNPSQYNSLMDAKMATTQQNYGAFKQAIDQAVNAYYSGSIKPTAYDLTSYYNPDVVDPSWGAKMTNQQMVGSHVFGALPNYGPSAAFSNSVFGDPHSFLNENRGTFGTSRSPGYGRSNLGMSFDGGQTYSGRDYSTFGEDSPSERSGIGRGSPNFGGGSTDYSGYGGLDSPSERGGNHFGGSTDRGNYSGYGGQDSPSEHGPGPGGFGSSHESPSHEANKDRSETSHGSVSSGGGHYAD